MDRITVIQTILDKRKKLNSTDYLEIGIENGNCWQHIKADLKIGVDVKTSLSPLNNEIICLQTSDEFFKQNIHLFDVIFIDGLHTYSQSLKDALNAYKCLKNGGFIVLHDCLPTSEQICTEDFNGGAWMGTVWKTTIYLKAIMVHFSILNTDCGLGILQKSDKCELTFNKCLFEEIEGMSFKDFQTFLKQNPPFSENKLATIIGE